MTAETLPPPRTTVGPIGWLRANLFSGIGSSILTVVLVVAIGWVTVQVVTWVVTEARWSVVTTNLRLFLIGQLGVFRPRTDLARVLIALAPLIGALLIAISRLEDYRHDVYDVTVGSLLGLTVTYFTYRRYYPALKSAKSDIPYPSQFEDPQGNFMKIRDEEDLEPGPRSYEAIPLQDSR